MSAVLATSVVVSVHVAGIEAAPPPTIASPRAEVAIDEDLSYEVIEATDDVLRILVIDRSGRNVVGPFPSKLPSSVIPERRYPVEIHWPLGVGRPSVTDPVPLLVNGMYRRGLEMDEDCRSRGPKFTLVCVGFYSANLSTGADFTDSINMPGDVSRALDVILSSPETFGAVDLKHVVYTGFSLGGIVGINFAHPLMRDPRITAIAVGGAAAAMWMPTFKRASTWRGAPPIFMDHGRKDPVIPYQQAKRTFKAAKKHTTITLVTRLQGVHGYDSPPCGGAAGYRFAWRDWRLGIAPRPDASLVKRSTCARFGVVKGGTTGYGASDPFVPDEYRSAPTGAAARVGEVAVSDDLSYQVLASTPG